MSEHDATEPAGRDAELGPGSDPELDADATALVEEVTRGRSGAADELLPLVYDELYALARKYLRRERPDHTLQPTALVNEAYLRMVDITRIDWRSATHFKAVAARAMKRVLVESARARNREKRGGDWRRVALDDAFVVGSRAGVDPAELNDALEAMRSLDPRQADVVELRLLGGLTIEEVARMLELAPRTVERDWSMGRTMLRRALSGDTT